VVAVWCCNDIEQHCFEDVVHRQWVFTVSKALHKVFYRDRRLLGALAQCGAATILELFAAVFSDQGCRFGVIASTQIFGDLLIWPSHIHCLVTDKAFDGVGGYRPLPQIDAEWAAVVFRERVFAMMKESIRIS
jgi:hypothetical protein